MSLNKYIFEVDFGGYAETFSIYHISYQNAYNMLKGNLIATYGEDTIEDIRYVKCFMNALA